MTQLNQIIAIEKGVRNRTKKVEEDLYHIIQKPQLFAGLSKTYDPKEDGGADLPAEGTKVQVKSKDVLEKLTEALTRRIDITATKDTANTRAKADIKIAGATIAEGVPVTTLISLEKELENLATFVGKLPILDPATDWEYKPTASMWAATPVQTTRVKKIPKSFVKYPATEQHPAQVEVFTEDTIEGTWTKIDFSGAMSAEDVAAIQSRLELLREAVQKAREEANTINVVDVEYGESILHFLFNGNGAGNGRSPQVSG